MLENGGKNYSPDSVSSVKKRLYYVLGTSLTENEKKSI